MSRTLFPIGLLLTFVPAANRVATAAEPRPGSDEAAPPNILWITAEDIGPHLGCYGDMYAVTPNLDRLAQEGVRYTHAFATAPVCSPARSCLITGLYATSLGTQHLRSAFPIPDQFRGYPTYLRDAGYYCTNNEKTDYNTANERAIIAASWDACSGKAHWRRRRSGQPFFAVFNLMVSHQSRASVWSFEQFEEMITQVLTPAERHDPAQAPVPPYYPDTSTVRRTLSQVLRLRHRHGQGSRADSGRTGGGRLGGRDRRLLLRGQRQGPAARQADPVRHGAAGAADRSLSEEIPALGTARRGADLGPAGELRRFRAHRAQLVRVPAARPHARHGVSGPVRRPAARVCVWGGIEWTKRTIWPARCATTATCTSATTCRIFPGTSRKDSRTKPKCGKKSRDWPRRENSVRRSCRMPVPRNRSKNSTIRNQIPIKCITWQRRRGIATCSSGCAGGTSSGCWKLATSVSCPKRRSGIGARAELLGRWLKSPNSIRCRASWQLPSWSASRTPCRDRLRCSQTLMQACATGPPWACTRRARSHLRASGFVQGVDGSLADGSRRSRRRFASVGRHGRGVARTDQGTARRAAGCRPARCADVAAGGRIRSTRGSGDEASPGDRQAAGIPRPQYLFLEFSLQAALRRWEP